MFKKKQIATRCARVECFVNMLFFLLLLAVTAVSADGSGYSKLLDPSWHEVINEAGMDIGGGRAKRQIQQNAYQLNVQFQECVLPNGKPGHCRHSTHCIGERIKQDLSKFIAYLCVIQSKSIGVCCPDDATVGGVEGLAGDLPATAPAEEKNEAIVKVANAQNRGCGLSTRAQGRVEDQTSRPANPREWPWMVSITSARYGHYCGGALITDRHVLTAAHCTRDKDVNEMYVRLGEYDFERNNDTRSYNFRVIERIEHEGFEWAIYHHDIAILKLHRSAMFNTYVWPICLPPFELQLDNEIATVIGWGAQMYKGPHSNVLMDVSVPVWIHQNCIEAFVENVFDENICAGGEDSGRDACQGDSGGPLMYQMASGRWAIIGVVSWGLRCGEAKHPGIYTRVDKYINWIVQNTRF